MKAIIHIGTHKTGTTTIQRFLGVNRNSLIMRGLYIPSSVTETQAQHLELHAATGFPNILNVPDFVTNNICAGTFHKNEFSLEDQEKYWGKYRHEIETNCQKDISVFFSNENLIFLVEDEISRLQKLMASLFDDVTIVLYLRRQPEYLVSLYSTHVRGGLTLGFNDYLNQFEKSPFLAYHKIVKRWSFFGKDKLKIRIFDKQEFHNNDLLSDFAHTIGIDTTGLIPVQNEFPSMGSAETEFLRLLNYHISTYFDPLTYNPDYLSLRATIAAISGVKSKQGYYLTRSEVLHILEKFREENAWIAREYLGREKLFNEDVSMYPEEVASPHGLTLERCAEIMAILWKERCQQIHCLQQENQILAPPEKDARVTEMQCSLDNLSRFREKRSVYWHYYRCKLLAYLTFGKKRKHYKAKRDIFHEKIREIRRL